MCNALSKSYLLLCQLWFYICLKCSTEIKAFLTSDGVSRLGLASRDPFFEVSVSVSKVSGVVSVSKDFGLGLELFVLRLCIGYFL